MKKLLIILFTISLGLFLWMKNHKPTDAPKNPEPMPTQTQQDDTQKVQSFSISGFSEDGKNKWQVEGESADIFSDVVNMHTIKAKTYGKGVCVSLTADEGTLFKDTNDVELRKNVIANTDEGTSLKTPKLKWQAATERIISEDYVYIEREDMTVSGTGARAVPDMKKVWINKDIQMTVAAKDMGFVPSDNKSNEATSPTVITCDGPLEVNYQKNISYFNKNVVIKDKEGTIYADRMIVYFDPKQKRIYKAVAKGDVKIVHNQNVSYSKEAIYLADEGKVILIGRPKVVIYSTDKLLEGNKKDTSGKL